MAQLDVEKKSNNDWWKWLLGILAAIAIIWFIVESMDDDEVNETDDMRETRMDTTRTGSLNNVQVAKYGDYSSKA